MKIYLASSWRNEDQPAVLVRLREAGHRVYDFRHPVPGNEGFSWKQVDLDCDEHGLVTIAALKQAHAHPVTKQGFKYDFDAMKDAEACVLLLPSGRSAHLEAGWMAGRGKIVYTILLGDRRVDPELMYKIFDGGLYDSVDGLLAALPNPDLSCGFRQWDRVRHRGPNGSYGEIVRRHPTVDLFYINYNFGLDSCGAPIRERSLGVRSDGIVRVPDEEYEAHVALPAWSEAQRVLRGKIG